MKFSISMVALLAATAIPSEDEWEVLSADDVLNSDDFEIIDLEVTNEAFGDHVFRGTAQSIIEEMEALQPGFIGEDVDVPSDAVSLNPLHKRAPINCNWGRTIYFLFHNCLDAHIALQRLGRSKCHVGRSRPNKPRTCARVGCSRGCGMYLCNKMVSKAHWAFCGSIADDIIYIHNECRNSAGGGFQGAMDFSTHYVGLQEADC